MSTALAYPQEGFANIGNRCLMSYNPLTQELLDSMKAQGIPWASLWPSGDDVYAICERCTEVMEMHRPGRLECLSCGLFHEVGE